MDVSRHPKRGRWGPNVDLQPAAVQLAGNRLHGEIQPAALRRLLSPFLSLPNHATFLKWTLAGWVSLVILALTVPMLAGHLTATPLGTRRAGATTAQWQAVLFPRREETLQHVAPKLRFFLCNCERPLHKIFSTMFQLGSPRRVARLSASIIQGRAAG